MTSGLQLLLGGFAAGVAMAAPVGPVAALCVSATLRRGPVHGVVAGLGASVADAAFAAVAVVGFGEISSLIEGYQAQLRALAGLVIAWVAIRRLRRPRRHERRPRVSGSVRRSFLGALLLTLSNPATIVGFAAVLGALGPHHGGIGTVMLVSWGAFMGALLWWTVVAVVTGRFRARSRPAGVVRFERVVSIVLLCIAAVLVAGSLV